MARIIAASIDLSKIDESKVVTKDKDGNPFRNGQQFYNVSIIINDEKDKYGNDTSIATATTKEEREAKVKGVFIGNGKTVWEGKGKEQNQTPTNNKSNYI
jgi:hypothetical protein